MATATAPQSLNVDRDELTPAYLADLTAGGQTVALVGPVGTGKTMLGINLAKHLSARLYIFGCTPDSMASELLGSPMPNPDGSGGWLPFVPGPAIRAWQDGAVLILDDWHRAGPGITSAANIVLNGASAQYTTPAGQTLLPHPDTRVVVTMNGDIADLDPDTRDRFRVRIPVMTPSSEMLDTLRPEVRLLVETDYDGDTADPIATFREWQSLSNLWARVGLARAALFALGTPERARKLLLAMAAMPASMAIPEAVAAVSNLGLQRGYKP